LSIPPPLLWHETAGLAPSGPAPRRHQLPATSYQLDRFRRRVLEEYERVGVPLEENKALVMRALSTRFPRDQMKKVHSIIAGRARR